jgi:hypothetical protein
VQRFDYNLYDVSPRAKSFVVNSNSDVPTPWTYNEFRTLILEDLRRSKQSSIAVEPPGKALMTFATWKTFWQQHGEANDRHSRCETGNTVSYDPSNYELTIDLSAAPPILPESGTDVASMDSRRLFETAELATGVPLSSLRRGVTNRVIWDGLPTIGPDELPPADWTE